MKNSNSFAFLAAFSAMLLISSCFSLKNKTSGNGKMQLVWSDEFDYAGLPNPQKWGYDVGDACNLPCGCGWGNHERQFYTDRRLENARVENGHLIIEARREKMGNLGYTSARLLTKNRGDWKFGRIEIRAKLPQGVGIWPAIWMLPTDQSHGGWPRSGEIDIMEFVGYKPDTVFGTVHTERFNGMKKTQKSVGTVSNSLSEAFHVYAIEWDEEQIDFFFDEKKYNTFKNLHDGVDAWPFDRAFHLILNVAVGGDWGGEQGVDDAIFPQKMMVDYVRVYQKNQSATAQNSKK